MADQKSSVSLEEAKNNNAADGSYQMLQDLNAVNNQLCHLTDPSAYIRSLPPAVKRRLKALKKLQYETSLVEVRFFEELHNLECKYENLYRPFLDKRYEIVSASVEPDDNECQWPSEDEADALLDDMKNKATIQSGNKANAPGSLRKADDSSNVQGIPDFWLRIFKNVEILSELIEDHDEPILRSLQDIRVKLFSSGVPGFMLEFHFEPNDFFTNTVLTKEYTLSMGPNPEDVLSYEGPEIVKCKGCTIDWKEGKNVTVKRVQKTQRRKGQDAKRTVVKTVRAHSFFNFFSPPVVQEGEAPDDETDEILSADFEIGHFMRDRIVPKAVLYFTGEALESEDSDDYDDEEGEEVIIDHTQASEEEGDTEEEDDDEDGSDQDPSQ